MVRGPKFRNWNKGRPETRFAIPVWYNSTRIPLRHLKPFVLIPSCLSSVFACDLTDSHYKSKDQLTNSTETRIIHSKYVCRVGTQLERLRQIQFLNSSVVITSLLLTTMKVIYGRENNVIIICEQRIGGKKRLCGQGSATMPLILALIQFTRLYLFQIIVNHVHNSYEAEDARDTSKV